MQDWDRFFGAIRHIEENLGRPLTVREISRAAFYSEFHFARMFRAVVGQSVMSYVQQRRLASAAKRVSDGERLLDVSLDHQFGSQEAFTRAFRRAFGITPGRYRRLVRPSPYQVRPPFSRSDLVKGKRMEPRMVEKETFSVVGLESEFDHESAVEIPKLWERFLARPVPNRKGRDSFGICESPDPKADRFRYTAAVEVADLAKVPRGLAGKRIPAGTYAVFTHRIGSGSLTLDLRPTLQHIWGVWLPNSKYEYTGAPDFELYDERFRGGRGELDLYVPVQRRR